MRYRGLSRKNGYKLINSDSKRRKPGNAAIVQRFPNVTKYIRVAVEKRGERCNCKECCYPSCHDADFSFLMPFF